MELLDFVYCLTCLILNVEIIHKRVSEVVPLFKTIVSELISRLLQCRESVRSCLDDAETGFECSTAACMTVTLLLYISQFRDVAH